MIDKIKNFLIIFLIAFGLFYYISCAIKDSKLEKQSEKIAQTEYNLEKYKAQLEKEHNDKVELDKQYKKLEAKAKSDKDFNWYADISSSPVIIELRD